MKNYKYISVIMAILALATANVLVVGCKHMDSDEHGSGHVHQYTCTHHPEVVQDSPGTCPKCGMKLVHKD
jgi:hypothetical protein